jgi:hypothetical protein
VQKHMHVYKNLQCRGIGEFGRLENQPPNRTSRS